MTITIKPGQVIKLNTCKQLLFITQATGAPDIGYTVDGIYEDLATALDVEIDENDTVEVIDYRPELLVLLSEIGGKHDGKIDN